MKKFYIAAMALLLSASFSMAQAPNQFSYQTVLRNSGGTLLTNSQVGVQISILKTNASGATQYVERHTSTTNANGLVDLRIGSGNVISGNISNINWDSDVYFIKTEIDPAGGSNYTISGTSQILSVPYALYAANGNWPKSGSNISNSNSGNVGVGTSAPDFKFVVESDNQGHVAKIRNTSNQGTSSMVYADNNGLERMYIGYANTGYSNPQLNGKGYVMANALVLATSNAPRLSINAVGDVGIGTENPTALLSVNGSANNTTGSWGTFSDSRLKNIDGDFSDGLSTILKINPVKFHYNDKAPLRSKEQQIGIIAQDLEKVAPYMVSKTESGDIKDLRQVNNQAYTFLLINAVKEQQAQIEALKADNAALKAANQENQTNFQSKIDQINARLEALLPAETAKK